MFIGKLLRILFARKKPIHISKALNMESKVSIKFLICLIFNFIIPKGKPMLFLSVLYNLL